MLATLRIAVVLVLIMAVITGVLYPLTVTLLAQGIFPRQANGSLILDKDKKIVGSDLIGQAFDAPEYFWSRPSATTPAYNASSSSGSNLGPTNEDQHKAVAERVKTLREAGFIADHARESFTAPTAARPADASI